MNKKLLSLILSVLFVFTALPISAFAELADSTIISVENVYAAPDSTVEVSINIDNNKGIAGATFTLTYDEKLTLLDIQKGDAFDMLDFTAPGLFSSPCNFAWDSESAVSAKNGKVLILSFKVSDKAAKNEELPVKLSYRYGDIYDANLDSIPVTFENGKITVINYIPGDVNGDGIVNGKDVTLIRRYNAGGYGVSINEEAADVNADGVINGKDVTLIRRVNAGGYLDSDGKPLSLKPAKQKCDHSLEKTEAKAATCTEDGNTAYWHCTKCDEYYSDAAASNVITFESTIVKASHNEIVKDAIPATTTSEGYTEGIWCDKCNTWISGHERIEPIKPNTRSITYNIVNEAKHPYLKTLQIDTSALDLSYTPGEKKVLKNLDLGKYGYTFYGWYDSFGDDAARIKEIPETATDDIELYAHLEETNYDITYNTYQTPVSSSPTEKQLHYTVSKGNANLYDPKINNYKFLGWYDGNGIEYKTIPIGTTENITLNAYYTSLRNLAVSKEDNNPIILEDQNANAVYFTYEIGEIRNIPLNGDNPFWEVQSVAGLSQQVEKTYTTTISNSEATSISKTISDMTTNSSTWSLSESWNNVTTVNETWAKSIGKTTEQCRTDATTSSNTLSISAQNGGSSYHKAEDGSTVYDYNSKTKTEDKGHQFNASLNGSYTNKVEANLGASTEYGATNSYGYTNKSKNNEYNHTASGSDKDVLSSGIKSENGLEANLGLSYGYHNNTTTVTKTGTDKVTTNSKIDENASNWNNSSAFSATQQHSSSQSVRNALSDIVTTTKGYGNSYSKGGTDSKTQGFTSTSSNTTGTTSSVMYSKLESETTTETYEVNGRIEGKYRSILVGTAHVFAVVGYDYATKSFFTYTFSVMDDTVKEWLDYTPKEGNFDDCEYSCLPFEVPYYVFEYVNGKTSKTTGIQYITDSLNGTAKITGYVGESADVIIPSYVSDGKQAYKVTEITGKAFAGKSIRSVVLGEFIKTIPDGAFKNCTGLEEVIGSFTEIGNDAFAGCTNLTNMNIPSNVVKIGTNAFAGAKSINVRAINSLSSYTEAVKLLPDGADEQINEKQKEITQEFIKSILECGAENIVLDISYIVDGTPLSLTIPEIESVEINGGAKTYQDFYIDSSAKNTSLSEMTINSHGTPIKVDSDKLTLHKVFVNGSSTALILKKDGAVLSLVQDSAIKTSTDYAVIGKNVVIESQFTTDGAAGYLNVTKNFGYVNSVDGEDYVNITDGKLIKISEDEFEKYILGQSTVTFDANEGLLDSSETSNTVFYGDKFGALPTPTREYHNFLGWFTEKDGGTEVTENTEVNSTENITLYAHWELKPLSGWVKASEMPTDAKAVNTKWNYKYTSTSALSGSGNYTVLDKSSYWSSYGSWSGWSKNSASGSDSRQVETKTVTDRNAYTNYKYYIYRTSDGYGYGTKGYQTSSHGACTKYDEINLTYALPLYNSGLGLYGPYNSSMFSHGYDCYWFSGGSSYVPAVTHTEYRYRDRHMIYSYTLESTANPNGQSGVSDIVMYVQYREK